MISPEHPFLTSFTDAERQLPTDRLVSDERRYCVYAIFDTVTGRAYIGRTGNIERRFEQHCFSRSSAESALFEVVQRHGREALELVILVDRLTYEESIKIEAERIVLHDTLNTGLNRNPSYGKITRERSKREVASRISVALDSTRDAAIREYARERGISINSVFLYAIDAFLNRPTINAWRA